jgi:hypothetical protein
LEHFNVKVLYAFSIRSSQLSSQIKVPLNAAQKVRNSTACVCFIGIRVMCCGLYTGTGDSAVEKKKGH